MIDRSAPPPPGEVRPFRFPDFQRTQLRNGLIVYAARLQGPPLISLEMEFPAGGQNDPGDRGGLATLTASLIDEGTERRGALEIAAQVERIGGYLTTGADWDVGYLAVGCLSQHLPESLDLLAEVVTSPTFPEEEIERLRRQRLAELLRRSQDPSFLADERLAREIYRGTVYAHSLLGDEESVSAISRPEVLAFYRRRYRLHGASLIAVGDLDPEGIVRQVEEAFGEGDRSAGEEPRVPEIRPQPFPGVAVHIVDRPGAAQTELRLGHMGISRNDPDYIPLLTLNALLGGKFTSRINLNLRERHGYTYGAFSRFVGRLGPGPFVVNAAVATEVAGAATCEALGELRRIREEPVEPAELEETLSYMIGVFPYTLQTIGDLAKRLETLATYGLPDDYFNRYLERLARVTREELLEVAQRHLHPDRIAVVAVGPAETLEPQLESLGPVTVWARQEEPSLAG
ncbi:MAG TPA: pitrilysin family protein [Thermoanaerobaculia bacterium]|nr:pitrilysin family protein [Thermoanaerobaculia bacterium]